MPQHPTVSEIEASIGRFSAYQTTAGAGQNISLHKKPAQQLLQAQNCGHGHDLSHHANGGEPPYLTDATIHAFDSSGARLTISGQRLTRLKASAKTYINADIMSEQSYHQALGNISGQSKEIDNITGKYWQNMAVGVCHAQIIDLFVEQQKDANGQAISKPRTGTIENEEPGVLLLSSPALNEAYGVGNKLSQADKEKYIEGMFRNLFNATQSEGRQHIALPPAGLGVFGGNPETYFKALNKVAKEFPDLSIYYNPAQNGQKFDALAAERPANVHKTDKDVVFLASELSRNGYPCALHNPSDADVVFGMYDPGEYWKTGKGANYVGEEHIGAMSTAPLNGRLMNPGAYNTTIVNHFTQQVEEQQLFQPQPHQPQPSHQPQHSQQSQQAIHSTSGIGTIPLQVSRNYQTTPPIHRIKQQQKAHYIPPNVAGSIYQKVIELGKAHELEGLTNDPRPEKFARALEIVGVPLAKKDLVSRRDVNGYQAKLTDQEFQKINEIHQVNQQRSQYHITPDVAFSIYKKVTELGKAHELEGLTNDPRPEKFAKALEIVGVPLAKNHLFCRSDNNGYQAQLSKPELEQITQIHQVKQQQRKDFHITPEIAESMYKACTAMGQSHLLEGLINGPRPNKLAKALEIVDVPLAPEHLQNSTVSDGYDAKLLQEESQKISQIHQTQQQKNYFHITPVIARSIYLKVDKMNMGNKLIGLTNQGKPEKFAKALEIVGVLLGQRDLQARDDYNGYDSMILPHQKYVLYSIHYDSIKSSTNDEANQSYNHFTPPSK